jgi:hypothetical protein
MDAAKRFNDTLISRAIEMDGTSTGEHGIGANGTTAVANSAERDLMADQNALDPRAI